MGVQSCARILLVDDHALFREAAARLLNAEHDLEVVGCSGSVEEALATLHTTQVDLVLLDLDLGRDRGLQFMKLAYESGFRGRVLVVAAVVGLFEVRRLIQYGAAGIFLKQNPANLLVDAIRAVMGGQVYMDPALHIHSETESRNSPGALTGRERDVLNCIAEGMSNKEIAARIHISEALVKSALQQLFDKNGVRTRSQLVRIALERYSGPQAPLAYGPTTETD